MFNQLSKYQTPKLYFTPAMQRARKPFAVKNAITGLLLFGFCGAVFSYSIMAVKQDDFDDVPMPSPPSTTNSEEKLTNDKK
ncbi:unnamed protein product [Rhizophagus irregularis]|uniref:Cytochrome c oxidase assembly factor 3 n=3 Tax=Rhizophagus irregularis TaxID=588596 RepID=A0A916DZY4_9GLOM|nr:hypothetical protein GLOIN_2v1680181 [Rhizophagus irregularis DAOM 181602=DAOM 197198]EXX52011.1 hypothetical protein RirG_256770 [Rhizophagus irregularis DAOM 197198w]UZO13982.1 hypothetical protein OCT59_005454 [Rhizophagus irregularis]POG64037.1 hypothetical protein GLOIN_2v1680181 [Rhizophagus irregularis DAOM 181602=DAOM 197198]CAB4406502.1 unnamed protein product [Rhizophagus irregularis]CAB5335452.1 unnamed protein product [Rhizophagus irregularis]|eukprot:XP_025170903.1 hypothetical protein GLOIN_2v1680181 [Rhizophagus irregularis DAOM 181602=DAOM 197198]